MVVPHKFYGCEGFDHEQDAKLMPFLFGGNESVIILQELFKTIDNWVGTFLKFDLVLAFILLFLSYIHASPKEFPPLGMKVCNNCTCANDNLGMEFKMHMCVGTLHCVFNFHHLTC